MKKNAIVLTSGLTGSSVLTGLISRAGYWTGDHTHKKEDYDTYENDELIDCNLKLFADAGYTGNYLTEFSPEALRQMDTVHTKVDTGVYQRFLDKCNEHRPWIWKDPRLWLTIHFWKKLLHLDECVFILLTRDVRQSWVSATLRRQIRSYRSFKNYEHCIQESITAFLKENKCTYLHVRYEDLILRPAETVSALNPYLHTTLTLEDLRKVYRKPLFKSPRGSALDYMKAVLIYLKNYSERVR